MTRRQFLGYAAMTAGGMLFGGAFVDEYINVVETIQIDKQLEARIPPPTVPAPGSIKSDRDIDDIYKAQQVYKSNELKKLEDTSPEMNKHNDRSKRDYVPTIAGGILFLAGFIASTGVKFKAGRSTKI